MDPLTVPGVLDSLAAISQYVRAAAEAAGLDKKAAYRLRLAVDEIATNVITHGYEEAGQTGVVEVQAVIEEKTLTILLEDNGASYEPDQVAEPADLEQPLAERPVGGLGLFLAIRNVDKFLYERIGDRNRHTFVVNRALASTPG
jgi:anti-sigma regulatory factor (Ser/Thr protein kinase)